MPPQRQFVLPPGLMPDALDAVAELTVILTRLRTAIQSAPGGGVTGTTPAHMASTPTLAGSPSAPLSLKDVPTATDNLKHKLQRARVHVKTLPDMDRAIADQEAEIHALETKIRKQLDVLGNLRDAGVAFASRDGVDIKMEI